MRPFTEPSPPQGTVCNALIGVDLYLREGDFRPSQTAMDDLRRWWVAERVGFEPTVALQRHAISSRAQSATLASLPGGEGDRSANISQYTIRCHKQRTARTQIRKAGYSCLDVS